MVECNSVSYGGWANCLELVNDSVRLVASTEVGPRILFYGFRSGRNFFHNFPDHAGKRGGDRWLSYGGHRLWYAPETAGRTYYPDNVPVPWRWENGVLTFDCPDEQPAGIKKSLAVRLEEHGSKVTVTHTFTNSGLWPVETALWAITVMAPGGTLRVPHEPFVPHGGGPGQTFLPCRTVTLWPFTDMGDGRFTWGSDGISLRQDDAFKSKIKFGVLNTRGCVSYELDGATFVKHYPYEEGAAYPDMNCNSEFYTEPGFLEIESLSPLRRIAEGESATHVEVWELRR